MGSVPVSVLVDARPVVLAEGSSVYWNDILPTLGELAGGEALQEVILDRVLTRELKQSGLTISEQDIARERTLLVEHLSDDLNMALRLLDELRSRQRLGRIRFQSLLRRNAALRALVQPEVKITESSVLHTYHLLYGEKRQTRILVTPSLADAETALTRMDAGEFFPDVAMDLSTDLSAARGGLLEPISQVDEGYPAALRKAIWKLQPGQLSSPILIDNQFAIVQLVGISEAQPREIDEVRSELESLTRLNQERLLMERLARRLMNNLSITFFNKSIEDSFRAARREGDLPLEP